MGNGFQISKTRKSIRPARNVFQPSGTARSVTSCPATSSMTTNCGSFKPEERATRVAAGIPMRVTAAAAMMVAQTRSATGIRKLANAHRITVANDPQVPGPGLRRPAPKNVAVSVAHSGARGRDAPATGGIGRVRTGISFGGVHKCLERSAAVLGGCRAGVPPAHPNPLPIFQSCRCRIFAYIANGSFQLFLTPNEVVIILPLPEGAVQSQNLVGALGAERFPGMYY